MCFTLKADLRDWLGGLAAEALLGQNPTAALSLLVENPYLELSHRKSQLIPATEENIALVWSMDNSSSRNNLLASVAASLPPSEGFALCEKDRTLVTSSVWRETARVMVELDPGRAKSWFLNHQEHPAASLIAYEIANRLRNSHPGESIQWVRDHCHGPFRNILINAAARSLDKTNPEAAAAARDLLPAAYKVGGKP